MALRRQPLPAVASPKGKSKVFWTTDEQDLVVRRAVDVQTENPGLSGLPLLRAAMMALPIDRRRNVYSINRVSWFKRGIKDEIKRRWALAESINPQASDTILFAGLLGDIRHELRRQTDLFVRLLGNGPPLPR